MKGRERYTEPVHGRGPGTATLSSVTSATAPPPLKANVVAHLDDEEPWATLRIGPDVDEEEFNPSPDFDLLSTGWSVGVPIIVTGL